jgi:hypothetical protein
MWKTTLLTCALMALASVASAQDKEPTDAEVLQKEGILKKDINRFVPSGKSRTVWFLAGSNSDCTPWEVDTSDVQTTKSPEHGTVEVVRSERGITYGKDSPQFKCNGRKVRGFDVNYKSAAAYKGQDEFSIFVIWPYGTASEFTFHVNVR